MMIFVGHGLTFDVIGQISVRRDTSCNALSDKISAGLRPPCSDPTAGSKSTQ